MLSSMVAAREKSASVRPLRVLVIDDEEDDRRLVECRLQASKLFEVHTAADGGYGMRAALELKPDVVLVDLVMPQFDGWGVCRDLRSNPDLAKVGIVLMTAHWGADSQALAQAFRVSRVLFKPLDLDAMVEAVRNAAAA